MKLPKQFFRHHGSQFTEFELDRDMNNKWVDAFEYDLETMRLGVSEMRDEADIENEVNELQAMLEYVASAKDADVPFDLGVCGLFFAVISVTVAEMNHIAAWARSVNFPELAPMTDAEKRAAVKRVEITKTPLDEWRKQRRAKND